jgi:hypothetical protein
MPLKCQFQAERFRVAFGSWLIPVLLFLIPAVAQAQLYTNGSGLVYYTNGGAITIYSYVGPGGAVSIPTNINGLTVAFVGNGANIFPSNNVTSVTIPDSVSIIGQAAFAGASSLTGVKIGNGVVLIEDEAFYGCSGLTNVTIPDSVISVGGGVFQYCYGLTSVTIGNGVTTIQDQTFQSCSGLTNVTIGNSLTSIGNFLFMSCSSLTSVTFPDSVTSIGTEAFAYCSSLTNVTIPNSVGSIGVSAFSYCTSLTNFTIPNGVTSIGLSAFNTCSSLTSVTIGNGVTSIGRGAFAYCSQLSTVYFQGNAPAADSSLFINNFNTSDPATVYYLPGTTGWGPMFYNVPAVLWNPVIQNTAASFGVQNNQFRFNISGTPNIPVLVEASTSLTSPVWQPLHAGTLTNGSIYFSDPLWTNYPKRFYRITAP